MCSELFTGDTRQTRVFREGGRERKKKRGKERKRERERERGKERKREREREEEKKMEWRELYIEEAWKNKKYLSTRIKI